MPTSILASASGDSVSGAPLPSRQALIIWLAPALIVVLDQTTKWMVATFMEIHQTVHVLGDWMCLTYVLNPGGAFGVQWEHPVTYFIAAAIVIGWIVWHLWRHGHEQHLSHLALALILGGAVGNLIDRLILGQVIDFIDVEFFDMRIPAFDFGVIHHPGYVMDRWPTFNVADSAVTVGVLALLVTLWHDPVIGAVRPGGQSQQMLPQDRETPAEEIAETGDE